LEVIYTRFVSMVSQRPTRLRLLPLDAKALLAEAGGPAEGEKAKADLGGTLLEPDPATILRTLPPKVLETKVYHLLLESLTAEYAARRMSMKAATDAAEEMRGELWRLLNRARQDRITKELLEIVGGAKALEVA
ncbi:MAG TPA: FoF1 ATP synthase subunit gamma, partial [Planctomycetota bacterium]|nr:FoF1 ATP synthase subunit gamma [Planctomycetota bacterium]